MMDEKKGSQIAKEGFKNEKNVVNKFNNWQTDKDAQKWLEIMGYNISKIRNIIAKVIHGHKADVQVQVIIEFHSIVESTQNIQVKLISNLRGYNQIDKRWVDKYAKMWNIPEDIVNLLKYFTGEKSPYQSNTKDSRRMFLNEFSEINQEKIINFFNNHRNQIISDLLKGNGEFSAQWMLVIQKGEEYHWVLLPINTVIDYYNQGKVHITPRGSLKIGKITMQRKGGDGGRKTSNMLQFKINPAELFEI